MPLTEQEKVRTRDHMGYLNVVDVQTFVLGTPAAVETQFLIEGAMNKVLEHALPLFRQILAKCDLILEQKVDDLENLAVDELGDIKLRKDEQARLDDQYDYWVAKLENMLGVPRNPFDKTRMGRGINVAVMG
jgi:hypothetical protein